MRLPERPAALVEIMLDLMVRGNARAQALFDARGALLQTILNSVDQAYPGGMNTWPAPLRTRVQEQAAPVAAFSTFRTDRPLSPAFAKNGRRISQHIMREGIMTWDPVTAQPVSMIEGEVTGRTNVISNPAGDAFATVSNRGRLLNLWNTAGPARGSAISLSPERAENGWAGELVSFSPDGSRVLTSVEGKAVIWDARTHEKLLEVGTGAGTIAAATFTPDGRSVVMASDTRTFWIWNPYEPGGSLRVLGSLTTADVITAVAYARDENIVYAVTRLPPFDRNFDRRARFVGNQLVAYDPVNRRVLYEISDPFEELVGERRLSTLTVADGKAIASDPDFAYGVVWDLKNKTSEPFLGNGAGRSVIYSPDGRWAVSSDERHVRPRLGDTPLNNSFLLWDARTGRFVRELASENMFPNVALSANGEVVAIGAYVRGGDDVEIQVHRTSGGRIRNLPRAAGLAALAITPDGQHVAAVINGRLTRVWEIATGLSEDVGTEMTGTAVALSPDGQSVAVGVLDGTVYLFDLAMPRTPIFRRTLEQDRRYASHLHRVTAMAFSADGQRLAFGTAYGLSRVVDANTGNILAEMEAVGEVDEIGFSAGDEWITSYNGVVRILSGNNVLRTLPGHVFPAARFMGKDLTEFLAATTGAAPLTLTSTREAAKKWAKRFRANPDGYFFLIIFPAVWESLRHFKKGFVDDHDEKSPEQEIYGIPLIFDTARSYLVRSATVIVPLTIGVIAMLTAGDISVWWSVAAGLGGVVSIAFFGWLGGARGHQRYLEMAFAPENKWAPLTLGSESAVDRRFADVVDPWLSARVKNIEGRTAFRTWLRELIKSAAEQTSMMVSPTGHLYVVRRMESGTVDITRIGNTFDPVDEIQASIYRPHLEHPHARPHLRDAGNGTFVDSDPIYSMDIFRKNFLANPAGEGTGLFYESIRLNTRSTGRNDLILYLEDVLIAGPAGLRTFVADAAKGIARAEYAWDASRTMVIGGGRAVGLLRAAGVWSALLAEMTVLEQAKILERMNLPVDLSGRVPQICLLFVLDLISAFRSDAAVAQAMSEELYAALTATRDLGSLSGVARAALWNLTRSEDEVVRANAQTVLSAVAGRPTAPSEVERQIGRDFHREYSPDGALVAVAFEGIRILDARTGAVRRRVAPTGVLPVFTADGRMLVYWSDGNVVFDNLRETVATVRQPTRPLDLSVSADGSRIAIMTDDRVRVLSMNGGEIHSSRSRIRFTAIDLSSNGQRLAVKDAAGNFVELIDLNSGQITTIDGRGVGFTGFLAFSPNGLILAIGSSQGAALYDIRSGNRLATIAPSLRRDKIFLAIRGLRYSRDGKRLLISARGISALVWRIDGKQKNIERIILSPEETADAETRGVPSTVVTATEANELRAWDVRKGEFGARVTVPRGTFPVARSGNGERVLLRSPSGQMVSFWDARTQRVAGSIRSPDMALFRSVFMSEDGTRAVLSTSAGEISVWDLDENRRRVLGDLGDSLSIVAISRDGRLAAALADFRVRVWDISTGASAHADVAESYPMERMAFSADGRKLLLASSRGPISVITLGEDAGVRLSHSAPSSLEIVSSGFDLSGRYVVLGFEDGTSLVIDTVASHRWVFPKQIYPATQLIDRDLTGTLSPPTAAPLTLTFTRAAAVWLAKVIRSNPDGYFFTVVFPAVVESPIHYFKWFVRLHGQQSPEQLTEGLPRIRSTAWTYFTRSALVIVPLTIGVVALLTGNDASTAWSIVTVVTGILSVAFFGWLGGVRGHMAYLAGIYFPAPAATPAGKLGQAFDAARRGVPIRADLLNAAMPTAEPLGIDGIDGRAAAERLRTWTSLVNEPDFVKSLSSRNMADADITRAWQSMIASQGAPIDAVAGAQGRRFVLLPRSDAGMAAMARRLANDGGETYLVPVGTKAAWTRAGFPAERFMEVEGWTGADKEIDLTLVEAALKTSGLSLTQGTLFSPDELALNGANLSPDLKRALIIVLINAALMAAPVKFTDLETIVNTTRQVLINA